MPSNSLGRQFNKGVEGIDFVVLWTLGLQLGKLKWLRAWEPIPIGGFFTHGSGCLCWLLAETLAVCIQWGVCVWSFMGRGFLTAWRLLGTWTSYKVAQSFKCEHLSEQTEAALFFYDLTSEIMESTCCHSLFAKVALTPPIFKGKGQKCHLLMS